MTHHYQADISRPVKTYIYRQIRVSTCGNDGVYMVSASVPVHLKLCLVKLLHKNNSYNYFYIKMLFLVLYLCDLWLLLEHGIVQVDFFSHDFLLSSLLWCLDDIYKYKVGLLDVKYCRLLMLWMSTHQMKKTLHLSANKPLLSLLTMEIINEGL